jgi:hypothetical protein
MLTAWKVNSPKIVFGILHPAGSAPKRSFETAVTVNTAEPCVAVRAKSATGRVLGSTKEVRPRLKSP